MRRIAGISAVALAALAMGVSGASAQKPPAQSAPTVPAATPYMGWDSYLAQLSSAGEASILEQADRLKRTGLEAEGYRLIWLDSGWWQGQRDAHGNLIVSATEWPHGIAWLATVLHANGFELGLYTDAGPTGCGVNGGLYGHNQQDINTFAAWGVDAIKVDWCGGAAARLTPSKAYADVHQAIANNASHRQMLLNICNFLQPGQGPTAPAIANSAFVSYTFGPTTGNSWRTDTDVGGPGDVPFSSVLRNMDADSTSPLAAGPGHWNDPDYLAPDQTMTAAQFQSQFSMWAILAAPLMVSDNMATMTGASLAIISNRQAIAIDQDPAGVQGWLVNNTTVGNTQVWVRPLAGGDVAVALLNRGTPAAPVSTTIAALTASGAPLPPASVYNVLNVWTNQRSTTTGAITATVAPYSTVLLRIAAK